MSAPLETVSEHDRATLQSVWNTEDGDHEKERIDTTTPQGKFMLTVFAAMADLEREQIRQRQREGIEIAKKEGKYKGRQPISYDKYLFEQLYRQWKAGDITQQYMCKKLKMSRSTLARKLREYTTKQ